MKKRTIQPDNMRKSFSYKLTPLIPSKPSLITQAKNQVKHQLHRHKQGTSKKRNNKTKRLKRI